MDKSSWHCIDLTIPFATSEDAQTASKALQVDRPLRQSVERTLDVSNNNLLVKFEAVSVRQARVAIDHFLSDVSSVVETIEQLGPQKS